MTEINPGLAQPVQAELSAHKALAACVATFVAVVLAAVMLGTLHGGLLRLSEVILGAAAILGIGGAVYSTPAKATLVVAPLATAAADPVDVTPAGDWTSA